MKEQDNILTLQETEQLCRLYMDCKLTVMEETELQYVLGKLPYSSPCIDETRLLMGIVSKTGLNKPIKRKSRFLKNRRTLTIAACFTLLFTVAITLLDIGYKQHQKETEIYIAYADGNKISKEQSYQLVMADMKRTEDFLRHVAELEAQEQKKIENFTNNITPEP